MLYLYTSELFPTVFRGTVLGFSSLCARIGGALAPPIDGLLKNEFMYIFGSLSVICGLITLLLRETKGTTMADSNTQALMKEEKLHFNSSEAYDETEKASPTPDRMPERLL